MTVLLLEAGGPDTRKEIHIPALFWKNWKTECDWDHETEPQPNLGNRKLYWPRGKVLGGSSAINAMVYIRGQHQDFDHWAELGNPGWGFRDVLPYFKKSENNERGADDYHGVGGPLNVADRPYTSEVSHAMLRAAVEVGFPRNEDFNGADQEGVGYNQVNKKNGSRCSAATAFLNPALSRPNLTVETYALATRIVFDRTRAFGVDYLQNGESRQVRAEREIVLCGGADKSPQLLLLSGVGPADDLRRFDIPLVIDLPGVGKNLQDHLLTAVAYSCTQPVSVVDAESWSNRLRYALFRNGKLTTNGGEAGGFVKSRSDKSVPDIQFAFIPGWFIDHGFDHFDGHGYTICAILLHPESHGYLTLRSADPQAPPWIQPNFCAEHADWELLCKAFRLCRRIGQAKALDSFRGEEAAPGAAVQGDQEVHDFIRQKAHTLYHPVGTCKMGIDADAVVDPRLRVRGVEGLRVADASIMPTIVGGNTAAATVMIGEKSADLILDE